jgi:aqualysin 1
MVGRVLVMAAIAVTAAGAASAQPVEREARARVIVQFKDAVAFDQFVPEFRPDTRLADARLHGYHSRGVLGAIMSLERRHGFRADAFYSRALKGFAASVTDAQRRRLEADPLVGTIEADEQIALEPITPAAQVVDWGINRVGADISSTASGNGSGSITSVNIYVIDTGVDVTHPDLNVVEHVTMTGAPNADCHGHGTGVAGIIAAKDNGDYTVGVVPGAPVHGVKVLSCEGLAFPSYIIQGVDWVTANAVKPAVANMSLGTLIPITAVNTAVLNSAATGIVYAVSAGNGNPFTGQAVNACYASPAGAGYDSTYLNGILTTAATDQVDTEASFSNFGVCVNIWAPGVQVTSLWLMANGGTFTGSGTSFASPHVAGGAALLLSRAPTLTPAWVEFLLRYVADVPGTFSKDGAAIRRLQIKYF